MLRYNLVFQGQIAKQASLDEVKKNLARLFKTDEEKIARLFSGKPVILKKQLDAVKTKHYLAALKQAGAIVQAIERSVCRVHSHANRDILALVRIHGMDTYSDGSTLKLIVTIGSNHFVSLIITYLLK